LLSPSCENSNKENTQISLEFYDENQDSTKDQVNTHSETENKQLLFFGEGSVFYWRGLMDERIPVEMVFQKFDDLLYGRLYYTRSKNTDGIAIIGTLSDHNYIDIKEFSNEGNITGLIYGRVYQENLEAQWSSPETEKLRELKLVRVDTIHPDFDITVNPNQIEGRYSYQFGPFGYIGDMDILDVTDESVKLKIVSITSEATGRNIAEVEGFFELQNNKQIYLYEFNNPECNINILLYKDFARVEERDCLGEFGKNASLHGIYYKVK
jgi:hypothetical protein